MSNSKRQYIQHGKDINHPEFPHGEFAGYKAGCKCFSCNEANNIKKKFSYRDRHPKIKKTTKICKICKEEKLLSEFYAKDGKWHHPNCKTCAPIKSRENRLLREYGITIEDFNILLKQQNNRCAICEEEFTDQNLPYIDHCHTHGHVRGLLHSQCNSAIGMFKDNPETCRKAAIYLEQGSTTISKESTLKRVEAPSSSEEDEDIVWTHSVMMSSS